VGQPPGTKVFIASARESKDLAKVVAQRLSDAGFDAVRWWTAFRPGDFTLDRLRDVAGAVDAAVLLSLRTDRTWYRGKETDVPRDNVVFEAGLFIHSLGRELAVVVADGEVRLPSDLDGLTRIAGDGDHETIAERVTAHLERVFAEQRSGIRRSRDVIPIEVDTSIVRASLSQMLPADWHQRSLYLGTEGARSWLEVSRALHASRPGDEDQIRKLTLDALRDSGIRSFVSLGPGDGRIDREIVISRADRTLTYLPVDISEGLLCHSCSVLSDYAHVPVGVLSDFEERLPFIQRRLRRWMKRPALIGILGNTFGNLDRFEATFLKQVESWLQQKDLLLLHVSIAAEDWSVERLPIASAAHSEARRHFFARGLARQLNVALDDVLRDYDARISHRPGSSDVPETVSVDFVDSSSGRKLQNVRWYRWPILLQWIVRGFRFRIRWEHAHYFKSEDRGEGVVLLERL
jgi:hypothetical protein